MRRTKLELDPTRILVSSVGLVVVIAIAHSVSCMNLIVPAAISHGDNNGIKYLLTQPKVWVTNSSSSKQSDLIEPIRVLNSTNTKISSDEDSSGEDETTSASSIPENSIEDLLAVESHGRLLTIGKHPPQTASQYNPPYASNLTQPTNQANYLISLKTLNNNTTTDNDGQQLQVAQIYRPPPPVFVRHPPSKQELRLLYPGHESLRLSSLATYNQSQWPWGFGHPSTPLGWSATSASAGAAAHQQPLFFLAPRQGRPEQASTAAPTSWQPQVDSAQHDKSLKLDNSTTTTTSSNNERHLLQAANYSIAAGNREPVLHSPNKTVKSNDSSSNNWLSTSNNSRLPSISQDHHSTNRGSSTVSPKQFPSLLGPQLSATNAEDELEHSLASPGHYQRTDSANMSWAQMLRQATEGQVMESLMVTNRSLVSLLCDTNDMLIRLKFKQPFHGSVSTNLDRRNSCQLQGTGAYYYELRISLQGCGTRQESQRLFINNIQIQFHPTGSSSSLNLVEDELKTIICSYPIRPRAPPPPDTVNATSRSGGANQLSERIIEAPGELPAKLVYYEPLFLISGLILLALTLFGLTTSAYMFSRRLRVASLERSSGRSSVVSSSSSSPPGRLYRNSPAQTANLPLMISPPLIGLRKPASPHEGNPMGSHRMIQQRPTILHTKHPTARVSRMGRNRTEAQGGGTQSSPTFGRHSNRLVSTVSINPAGDSSGASGDSLADKNDRVSVTTIEIPYAGQTSDYHQQDHEDKKTKSIESVKSSQPSPSAAAPVSPRIVNIQGANKNNELSPTNRQPPIGVKVVVDNAPGSMPRKVGQLNSPKATSKSSPRRGKEDNSIEKYMGAKGKESKEVQVGGMPAQPFESIRPTLTSPEEFKRLQEIVSLFDEILIENHVDRGDDSTIVYETTRLSPSKYKTRILDSMDEDERRLVGDLLQNDEIFRSLVVESTSSEMFHRKLRTNPTYSGQFKPEAWQLLEEILLDPNVSSETGATKTPPGTLPDRVHQRTRTLNRLGEEEDSRTTSKARKMKPPTTSKKPHRRKSRTRSKEQVEEKASDHDESVLGERKAAAANRPNSGPQIQSESRIKWPAAPDSGDSLESAGSKVYFVMYERHLFVT